MDFAVVPRKKADLEFKIAENQKKSRKIQKIFQKRLAKIKSCGILGNHAPNGAGVA